MLPLELDCHTSRAITGRTVLFRSLRRLHRFINSADLPKSQCSLALFHWVLLLIVTIRNDSNLTKISCGLRLAGDSLQPIHAARSPRRKLCPQCTGSRTSADGTALYRFRAPIKPARSRTPSKPAWRPAEPTIIVPRRCQPPGGSRVARERSGPVKVGSEVKGPARSSDTEPHQMDL
jgi:hypothetical protein